jgi:hypothetical protein
MDLSRFQTEQTDATMQAIKQISRNAATAKKGFQAEKRLCELPQVKSYLETYFAKPIQKLELVPGKKKSDLLVVFQDETRAKIQNKDGKGNGRGWSADRRCVDKMPVCEAGKTLLRNICLKKAAERPVAMRPPNLIGDLLLGSDEETKPTHFTHTEFHKESGELLALSIVPAPTVIQTLNEKAYPQLLAKRTCVHISPLLYLQRKGGGSKDHAPDDIQLKLKELPSEIMTCLYPLSQAQPLQQLQTTP